MGTWLTCCLLFTAEKIHAQADSTRLRQDSTILKQESFAEEIPMDTSQVKRLDPRKALFYSAVLPGLGQMYNGKYWKLPFVYGGFVGGVMVVSFYQKNYVKYRDELYILLADGGTVSASGRTETNLRYIVDKTRRERDYYTIITGLWYILQIVDAHVDAHLQEFKVSKDMRISLEPSMYQNMLTGRTSGLTLTFKF